MGVMLGRVAACNQRGLAVLWSDIKQQWQENVMGEIRVLTALSWTLSG